MFIETSPVTAVGASVVPFTTVVGDIVMEVWEGKEVEMMRIFILIIFVVHQLLQKRIILVSHRNKEIVNKHYLILMIVNDTLISRPPKLLLVSLAQDTRSSMMVLLLLMVFRMFVVFAASSSSTATFTELAAWRGSEVIAATLEAESLNCFHAVSSSTHPAPSDDCRFGRLEIS